MDYQQLSPSDRVAVAESISIAKDHAERGEWDLADVHARAAIGPFLSMAPMQPGTDPPAWLAASVDGKLFAEVCDLQDAAFRAMYPAFFESD